MDGIQAAQKSARDAAGQWMYGQPEDADAAYKHGTLVALIAIAEELREIRKVLDYYTDAIDPKDRSVRVTKLR